MSGYENEQTGIRFRNESSSSQNVFEREFAKRTLENLRFIERAVEVRHQAGLDDKDIHDVFEVTQLINSFVGLLILPKESFYKKLENQNQFLSDKARMLFNNINNRIGKYESTYTYKENGVVLKEPLTPQTMSRHLRNAIAHNNLEILPKDYSKGGKVEGFVFKDNNTRGETFRLELTIDEIRTLLLAECELILSLA